MDESIMDCARLERVLRNPPRRKEKVRLVEKFVEEHPAMAEEALQSVIDWEMQRSPGRLRHSYINWYVDMLLHLQKIRLAVVPDKPKIEIAEEVHPVALAEELEIDGVVGKLGLDICAYWETDRRIRKETEEAWAAALAEPIHPPRPPATGVRKVVQRVVRTIGVAAIMLTFCSITAFAATTDMPNGLSSALISMVEDTLEANFNNVESKPITYTNTDNTVMQRLKDNGFESIVLPKALLDGIWTVSKENWDHQEFIDVARLDMKHPDYKKQASIVISRSSTGALDNYSTFVNAEQATQVNVNGINVLLTENGKQLTTLAYADASTGISYTIFLPFADLLLGKEIANTL